MRERPFLTEPVSSLVARGAARATATILATLGLLSGGIASAATSFQLAYMYGTSGPASGGTAVNLVGNQFQPGATVTIGGVSASSSVTSSTRIGATAPARAAGALYDVIVTNPAIRRRCSRRAGSRTSSTFRSRAPSMRRSRRSSATASPLAAATATTARLLERDARADGRVPAPRRARADLRAPGGDGHGLQRRPGQRLSPPTGSSSSTPRASRAAARAARLRSTARRPR